MRSFFSFLSNIFWIVVALMMTGFLGFVAYLLIAMILWDKGSIGGKLVIAIPASVFLYFFFRSYIGGLIARTKLLLAQIKAFFSGTTAIVIDFHWREIRRKDLIATGLAIAAIATFEFLSPSLVITGKPKAQKLPEFGVPAEKMVWGKENLTYSQIGSSANWLQYLTREKHLQLTAELDALRDSIGKKPLERKANSSSLTFEILQRKGLYEASYRLNLINPDAQFPRLEEPIEVFEKVYDPSRRVKLDKWAVFNGSRGNASGDGAKQSALTPFTLVDQAKRLYLALNNRQRPDPTLLRPKLSCFLTLNAADAGNVIAERYCDLTLLVPIDYDLENNACLGQAEPSNTCVERWITPQLVLRFFSDRIVAYFSGGLKRDYSYLGTQDLSYWMLEISGQQFRLGDRTEIPLPRNLSAFFDANLLHAVNPGVFGKVGLWRNIDVQMPWLGAGNLKKPSDIPYSENYFQSAKVKWFAPDEAIEIVRMFLELPGDEAVAKGEDQLDLSRSSLETLLKLEETYEWNFLSTAAKLKPACSSPSGTIPQPDKLIYMIRNKPNLSEHFDKLSNAEKCAELGARVAIQENFLLHAESKYCSQYGHRVSQCR